MNEKEFLATLREFVRAGNYLGASRFASEEFDFVASRLTREEVLGIQLGPLRLLGDVLVTTGAIVFDADDSKM